MTEERKPMAIIAADPGKMSGVAIWREDCDRETPGDSIDMLELNVTEFFDVMHDTIHELYGKYDIRIVYEGFLITVNTAKNTQASWSLELIGVLKFLCHRYHLPEPTRQMPSVGKTFGTNGKLKYLGWYRSGGKWRGHANDAARHLATFAAQRGFLFSTEQLVAMADV